MQTRTDQQLHLLDLDTESIAAGFADPQWVPQKISCVAYSWFGSDIVHSGVCGEEGFYSEPWKREDIVYTLRLQITRADMVVGHNLIRHDLPILNAECMRLGLDPLPKLLVHDTMRIIRTKGFKKGQDNLARLLGIPMEKQAMDWQQWEDAYRDPSWDLIRRRCETDVLQHKFMYTKMKEKGWLKPPVWWKP